MADDPTLESRYCPSCGARVKAPAAAFQRPRKCPKCQAVVTFFDYPNEARDQVPPVPEVAQTDWFDYALYVSFAATPLFLAIAFICVAFGLGDWALFAGGICLVLALPLWARFGQLQGTLLLTRRERDELRTDNERLRDSVAEAGSLAGGFRRNFDSLLNDHKLEQEKRYARAEKLFAAAEERQRTVDALAARFLKDTVSNISSRLTSNNFTASSDRLRKTIDFCRKSRYDVDPAVEKALQDDLRKEFSEVLHRQELREEQSRIKAQIREEQRAEREMQRELQRVAAEKVVIEKALAAALQQTHDIHSVEVERLQAMLADAEARAFRTLSMAQQTKAGHIYVISNLGSFGESVYKVGMTRRLEPLDRVKELGDASVPFSFDVHMMISCDDAPKLENALHRALHHRRINRVNLRKEFFRATLDEIREIVERHHGQVDYQATAEALEYYESQNMSDEEFEFLSKQFAKLPPEDDEAEELADCIESVGEVIAD